MRFSSARACWTSALRRTRSAGSSTRRASKGCAPLCGSPARSVRSQAPYAKQTTSFVTGLEGAGDDLLRRSEAYLQAGAVGIDLGTIVPPQVTNEIRLDRLSDYCAMLHAAGQVRG